MPDRMTAVMIRATELTQGRRLQAKAASEDYLLTLQVVALAISFERAVVNELAVIVVGGVAVA